MKLHTPKEVEIWAESLARQDIEKHKVLRNTHQDQKPWQVDLNPYSTDCARSAWQRGFEGKPSAWDGPFALGYQRGKAVAKLLSEEAQMGN